MLKQVNFIIRPSNVRPPKIRSLGYGDVYDYELDQVELAALRETLQTSLGPNPFSAFIRNFLVTYSEWLKWWGDGPGIGREMRRTFSGLFGRFFARAYLSDCHGFVWFTPLDGRAQDLAPRLRVSSIGRGRHLPDWICAGRNGLALAEAKGARGGSRLTYSTEPSSLKSAKKQLQNCRVSVLDKTSYRWVDRKVKGWAVLNQWSFQLSPVEPYLYVIDPDTKGEALPLDELPLFVRYVARGHVGSIFRGLGLYGLANSVSYLADNPFDEAVAHLSATSPTIVAVTNLDGVRATGRLFRLGPGAAGPSAFGEEIFIGVQNEVIEDLQGSSEATPLVLEPHSTEELMRGPDGFIVARQSAVTHLSEG
jgi:hypothetical protein